MKNIRAGFMKKVASNMQQKKAKACLSLATSQNHEIRNMNFLLPYH